MIKLLILALLALSPLAHAGDLESFLAGFAQGMNNNTAQNNQYPVPQLIVYQPYQSIQDVQNASFQQESLDNQRQLINLQRQQIQQEQMKDMWWAK